MLDQLEHELKQIEQQIIQKKRKAMIKKINAKIPGEVRAHRKLSDGLDYNASIMKRPYAKELAKISDRPIPTIKTYGELDALFFPL